MAERETLEVDVLVVGGGVGGLACAIHVVDKVHQHNRLHPGNPFPMPNVLVIEKGVNVGAHVLSGCVMDPRGIDELIPDWHQRGAPIRQKVTEEEVALLTPKGKIPFPTPALPPYLHNHGNYVVSLSEVAAWMGEEAKKRGIEVLEGVAGAELILEDGAVRGVICNDTGVDKNGKPGANYTPGARIIAKATVFAEGVRGSLTKVLVRKLKLDADRNPQTYAIGTKELWEVPAGTFPAGKVMHTLGYPLQEPPSPFAREYIFGGSFIYGQDETHVVVGLVVGLDHKDPAVDCHNELQRLKLHPEIRKIVEQGKLVAYGAKAIPEGGYYAMPRFYGNGFVIVGDSASFLNPARLKGAHLAMKSGMLAAEALVPALVAGDCSERMLGRYEDLFRNSWAFEELHRSRNWRAAFADGVARGVIQDIIQQATGGRGLVDPLTVHADHERTDLFAAHYQNGRTVEKVKPDDKITFSKITDVYHSGTAHGEHQPCHLVVPDSNICVYRCTAEFGNPCQHFCPANVYEWIPPKPAPETEAVSFQISSF